MIAWFDENGFYKKLDDSGYIFINVDGRWIQEHRYVVERFIGRPLNREEVIHHISEDKQDNSLNNLMLFSSQREHASFHRKIRQHGMTRPILYQIQNRWKQEVIKCKN